MILVYIMLGSQIFRHVSAKLSPKTKSSSIVETYCWDGEFSKRLFSDISEQDFNQNVEVTYSIYLAVY